MTTCSGGRNGGGKPPLAERFYSLCLSLRSRMSGDPGARCSTFHVFLVASATGMVWVMNSRVLFSPDPRAKHRCHCGSMLGHAIPETKAKKEL